MTDTMNASRAHLGRFRYEYPDGLVFEVDVPADDTLHWRCVAGANQGREGREAVDRVPLDFHQHMLSWTEGDGLTVVQVVDYNAGTVHTVLVQPGAGRVVVQGTVCKV